MLEQGSPLSQEEKYQEKQKLVINNNNIRKCELRVILRSWGVPYCILRIKNIGEWRRKRNKSDFSKIQDTEWVAAMFQVANASSPAFESNQIMRVASVTRHVGSTFSVCKQSATVIVHSFVNV